MDNKGRGTYMPGVRQLESNHLTSSHISQVDQTVSRISMLLISANYNSLTDAIQELGRTANVDSGIIIKFNIGFVSANEAYVWKSHGESQIEFDDSFFDKSRFRHWLDRLDSRGVAIVGDKNDMESLSPEEEATMKILGLKSFLMVPIFLMDESIGGLIVLSSNESRKGWSEEIINACKSVSEMIATVWNHQYALDELSMYRHHLEEIVQSRTNELECANRYLQKEIEEHKRVSKELQECRVHLENIVKDHTTALSELNRKLRKEIEDKIIIEKSLREAEEKYRPIINNSQDLMFMASFNGIIEFIGPQVAKFGYTREEVQGRNILEFVHPDDKERIGGEFLKAIESGEHETVEFLLANKNGSYTEVEELGGIMLGDGKHARFIGVIRDITDRKKAIRESEERFRQLSNATFEAIEIHDGAKILEVNQACLELFGYERKEIIGLDPLALAVPGHREMIREKIQSEDCESYEAVGLRKDGSTFFGEVRGKQVEFCGKKARVSAIRNITEKKVSDLALRESEKKYRILAENVKDVIWIVDLELRYTYISPSVEKMLGFADSEMVNNTIHNRLTSASLETALQVFEEEMIIDKKEDSDPNRVRKLELEVHCKDGSTLWTEHTISFLRDDHGNPVGFLGVARDINERKRAEAELRKSRRQYQVLFNSILEGISIFDENENIKFCNPAFASMLEVESENDLIGRSFLDFVDSDQKELIIHETKKRKGGQSSKYELEIITAMGNKKRLLSYVSPRFDEDGNFRGSFGALMDVTETRRLQEFSSRAQRLETAGRIASQVAHDFNNLLGPMTAYPELIKEELPEGHPAHKYLDDIYASAKRMADINQQLLTLGRRGHYNLEIMNLNDVLELVLDQVFIFDKSIVINKALAVDLQNINGGKSQIYRAISNIVINAQDAMPDGGTLNIKTENVRISEFLGRFTKIPEGEYVKLSISDTGSGIPTEILPRIFEPFFTSKLTDRKRGSGLGLSVVHAVIEDHNAFIDWDSVPEKGTSFFLYFPVSRNEMESISDSHVVGGDESILVIDDDVLQHEVTMNLLEKLGYKVETAFSGEEGVELLKKNRPDLVLLDMIMPGGMDGAETYRKILDIIPNQKAIIVSGFAETGKVEEALKLGVNTFLRKPLTIRSLARALRNELDSGKHS